MLSSTGNHLKLESILSKLEVYKDDFKPDEIVQLIKSLSKIQLNFECKHDAEILYFTLFRKSEKELDQLTSKELVALLFAYRMMQFKNRLILGYLALEWTRRLERMSDLQVQAVRVPRRSRNLSMRRATKAETFAKPTYYFDISSAC